MWGADEESRGKMRCCKGIRRDSFVGIITPETRSLLWKKASLRMGKTVVLSTEKGFIRIWALSVWGWQHESWMFRDVETIKQRRVQEAD